MKVSVKGGKGPSPRIFAFTLHPFSLGREQRNHALSGDQVKPPYCLSDEMHAVVSRAGGSKLIQRQTRERHGKTACCDFVVARLAPALVQTPRSGGQPPRRATTEPQLRRVAAAP